LLISTQIMILPECKLTCFGFIISICVLIIYRVFLPCTFEIQPPWGERWGLDGFCISIQKKPKRRVSEVKLNNYCNKKRCKKNGNTLKRRKETIEQLLSTFSPHLCHLVGLSGLPSWIPYNRAFWLAQHAKGPRSEETWRIHTLIRLYPLTTIKEWQWAPVSTWCVCVCCVPAHTSVVLGTQNPRCYDRPIALKAPTDGDKAPLLPFVFLLYTVGPLNQKHGREPPADWSTRPLWSLTRDALGFPTRILCSRKLLYFTRQLFVSDVFFFFCEWTHRENHRKWFFRVMS